jgi:hypothetical protein
MFIYENRFAVSLSQLVPLRILVPKVVFIVPLIFSKYIAGLSYC